MIAAGGAVERGVLLGEFNIYVTEQYVMCNDITVMLILVNNDDVSEYNTVICNIFYVIRRNGSIMFPYLCSNGLHCCYPFVSILVTLQFNIP